MPWKELTVMSQRIKFVSLALEKKVPFAALCRQFGISRTTGYKWLKRFEKEGEKGLQNRSTKPDYSPNRTAPEIEKIILDFRDEKPVYGACKIKRRLTKLGHENLPAPSTIAAILKRNRRIDPEVSQAHKPFISFEMDAPNKLWQMDFKGHFPMKDTTRCHPLALIDDHSRYNIALNACSNETTLTVRQHLIRCFRNYGLPQRILTDNGSPWGNAWDSPYTKLTVWIMGLGIAISHGRAYHPQTQGKVERFNRTLSEEVINNRIFDDLVHAQDVFTFWRAEYNHERPHHALGLDVPASRYERSQIEFPEVFPVQDYSDCEHIRKVGENGKFSFKNKQFKISKGFCGYRIGICSTLTDGVWDVRFNRFIIARLDERFPGRLSHRFDREGEDV